MRRFLRGWTVRRRLTALVVVPMTAITMLFSSVAATQNERVAAGELTIARLEQVRNSVELRPLLATELVARQEYALATITDPDGEGGAAIEATVAQAVRQVDDHLARDRVAPLDEAIEASFGGMEQIRAPYLDDEFVAISLTSPHHVTEAFLAEEVDATLIDILSSLTQIGRPDLSGRIELTRALDDLAGDQINWTTSVAISELDGEADISVGLAALALEANDDVSTMAARHPELVEDLENWDDLLAGTERRFVIDNEVTPDERLDVLTQELQRLKTVQLTAVELVDETTEDLRSHVADAKNRAWLLAAGSWSIMAFGMIGVFVVARSIDKPLVRLRDQARRIIGGDLRDEPGARSGPPELVEIGTSLDELVTSLNGLALRAEAVARGEFDDDTTDDGTGGPLASAVTATVDRLRHLTGELRHSESKAQTIIDAAADPILVLDPEAKVEIANPAALRLLRGVDLTGVPATAFFRDWVVQAFTGDQILTAVDGTRIDVSVSLSTTEGHDGPATVVLVRDITEQKRTEAKLTHDATHDPLTGLLNRAGIMARLDGIDPDDPVGVMFLDLDKFKPINDTHGHDAGDEVLTEIGHRLADAVRGDESIGRLGGDEFVVVMPGAWDLEQLAARLVHVVEEPIALTNGVVVSVGTSIGLATGWGGDTAELLRKADEALYACKHERSIRISSYTDAGPKEVEFHGDVSRIIAEAIARDELVLAAQPMVDIETGFAVGYELLVRWDHPSEGLLPPGAFLPVTEQSDAILLIDQWVLRSGSRWAADHPGDWGLSLNISMRHLERADLGFIVRNAVQMAGLAPQRLQLEFSETAFIAPSPTALATLDELRDEGIRIARDDAREARMDDPGHGGVFDAIKIDVSLVHQLDRAEGRHRVAGVVDRAHRSGQAVVAVGVESEEQLLALRDLGVRFAQGFYYGQPVALDGLSALLRG